MNPEITKEIEQYIAGELSQEQKVLFEQKMASNEELLNEVNLQKTIHEAAQRSFLRNEVASTANNFHFYQRMKWGGIGMGIVLLIASITAISILNRSKSDSQYAKNDLQRLTDSLKTVGLIDNLNSEFFVWVAKDTAFLSRDGVLVSVPENAFLLDGTPYIDNAVIQWQEALDGATIVKAGLSTTSNGRLLETQGMFSFTAKTLEGKQLTINPEVGVYVQVPVDDYKNGMQLFDGIKDANGMINWVNPKQLEKIPVPIPMTELDFYPPEYEAKLNELKAEKGKIYRDSLYLSFEKSEKVIEEIPHESIAYITWDKMRTDPSFPGGNRAMRKFIVDNTVYPNDALEKNISDTVFVKFIISETGKVKDVFVEDPVYPSLDAEAMRVVRSMPNWIPGTNMSDQSVKTLMSLPVYFEIDGIQKNKISDARGLDKGSMDRIADKETGFKRILPSSVLAFWKSKFNNTILSTREFEERMKEIHKTCDPSVLDIYVKNMNKPLYELDEKVAAKGYSKFKHLADQRVGAIDLKNAHLDALNDFYDNAVKDLIQQEKANRDREQRRREKWDKKLNKERERESKRTTSREEKVFNEEYNLNLRNVRKQLGPVVGATIHGQGTIYNIDRYVMEATADRTSTTITDPDSGKTAKIQYNDFEFSIENHEEYSQLYAYLFPRELNSYHRLTGNNGSFEFPLNDAMEYDLVIVGISDKGYSFLQSESVKGGDLGELVLERVSEEKVDASIQKLNSKRGIRSFDVKQELQWLKTEQQNYVEQKRRSDDRKFREQLRPKVFPCDCETEDQESEIAIELN